jgi:hypothetical protein
VTPGFDCVSFGIISIDALFIVLIARRVDLIIDCPISEFFPVKGTRRPILIFSFAKSATGVIKKPKAKKSIILIILFILMLLL